MRHIGAAAEDRACRYLEGMGFAILDRNVYSRYGELDVIARKANRLHVIEVKYVAVRGIHSGYKLNWKKQRRMVRCTQLWLSRSMVSDVYVQFDLIAMAGRDLHHYENVFQITHAYS